MRNCWLLFACLLVAPRLAGQVVAENSPGRGVSIIPLPENFRWEAGNSASVHVDERSPIRLEGTVPDTLGAQWRQYARSMWENVSQTRKRAKSGAPDPIVLRLDTSLSTESYRIHAADHRLRLVAGDAAGMFYAFVSLQQILEQHPEGNLPEFEITDRPRFGWRGMHLDVCRHFFSVEEIKRYLDLLARYKINRFHWHLTEDQGWRLPVPSLPGLSKVAAWRRETLVGRPVAPMRYDGRRYGGYYTRQDIREVVAYARERHIVVVPEIEMPGHALAALAAYPELSCTGGPFEPATHWGVFEDVFCAGKDTVFRFLETVLGEVVELFPGPWVHIGGDECPKKRWETCPDCQTRIREEGLADEHELQSYFIKRIERILKSKGRKLIGWDEILEGGLAPEATVMSWRGTEGGIAAAQAGHDAIMSPGRPCYFDHYQAQPDSLEPLAICCYNPLPAVYAYEPVPDELTGDAVRHILGAQGNVWTEYMPTFDQVTYMALPRMPALAEVLWSPPNSRHYPDFVERLCVETGWLDRNKFRYARHFLAK